MRLPRLSLLLAGCLAAATTSAQQSLLCPAPPAGRPCDAYHYHVQMYRPDTRAFVEFYGGTSFANEAACNRAREQQVSTNRRVVEFMRANKDQKYEPDRVGGCHCDMTRESSSPTHLGEPQRAAQWRMAEDVRLRVRERLLDRNAPSDSEVVRSLWSDLPSTPSLSTPKLVPPPPAARAQITTAADDLRPTRTLETARATVAALDLPLADIGAAAPAPAPAIAQAAGAATPPPAPAPAPAPEPAPAPAAPVAAEPVVEERVVAVEVAEPAAEAEAEETDPVEETAERFISYETQRIQNVLRASSAINDENVKTRIFEASMERIQLLSNLRLLIEGSGARSRLATAAREAFGEEERLALVARLFGSDMPRHWAPKDAADVAFDVDADVAAAPERVLRDSTGQFTADQKKRALYLVLARTQPTEEQRLWLSTIVEGFLR